MRRIPSAWSSVSMTAARSVDCCLAGDGPDGDEVGWAGDGAVAPGPRPGTWTPGCDAAGRGPGLPGPVFPSPVFPGPVFPGPVFPGPVVPGPVGRAPAGPD